MFAGDDIHALTPLLNIISIFMIAHLPILHALI